LLARLSPLAPALIVLEATGGYEAPAAAALASAGFPVAIVNARQIRAFARATGLLAKTDVLDARVIAHFAEAVRPPVRPSCPSPKPRPIRWASVDAASDRPEPTGRRLCLMSAAVHGKTRFSLERKGGQREGEGRMAPVGGDESRPGCWTRLPAGRGDERPGSERGLMKDRVYGFDAEHLT
jgi:hypothetical protein